MAFQREDIVKIAGAVISVLLQAFLAPHLVFFGGVPNFIAAYCMAFAVVRSNEFGCIMPFCLGLVYDVLFGGPVGAMALCLLVFSTAVARMFAFMDNDTLFMPLAAMAVGLLLVDVFYGVIMLMFGYPIGLLEAIGYRIFPCFACDVIVGVVFTFLARRFLAAPAAVRSDITQLR